MSGRKWFAISVALLGVGLLFGIWTVVPAPTNLLWMVALGVSEWSVWLLVPALLALFFMRRVDARPRRFLLPPLMALFLLAFYPYLSAGRVDGDALSWKEYFVGPPSTGDTLREEEEVFAEPDGKPLHVDIVRAPPGTSIPLLVIHGGSWRGGERNDNPRWNKWFATQGYTVFDIDYRLAPQPNFREAVGDVKCALAWIAKHAERFSLDVSKLAVLGRSAGAHLALLAAYSRAEARLPSSCPDLGEPPTVDTVIALYGSADLTWGYDHVANPLAHDGHDVLQTFIGGTPADKGDLYRLLSPLTYAVADGKLPHTIVFHGERDQLIRADQARFLATRAHADVTILPYAQHAFDYNFQGWGSQIMRRKLRRP